MNQKSAEEKAKISHKKDCKKSSKYLGKINYGHLGRTKTIRKWLPRKYTCENVPCCFAITSQPMNFLVRRLTEFGFSSDFWSTL